MQVDLIQFLYKINKIPIPIHWIERKYHNNPDKLKTILQETINRYQDMDEILLSYGLCGNAVIGLKSDNTKIILPRYDDCICQQIQTNSNQKIIPQKGCMYLTREWTLDEEGIVQQCQKICEEYGEEAFELIQSIYGEYHSVTIIDTGAYNVHKLDNYVDKIKKLTGMGIKYQKGSGKVLENLLLGNYQEDINVIPPGNRISIKDFYKQSIYKLGCQ